MKLNVHGIVGIFAILLMTTVAAVKHWDINWVYYGVAVVLYSVVILFFSLSNLDRNPLFGVVLIGCHFAFILLGLGLLLDLKNPLETLAIFIICTLTGLIFIFLCFVDGDLSRPTIGRYGTPGIVALLILFAIRGLAKDASLLYFFAAIVIYSVPIVLSMMVMANDSRFRDASSVQPDSDISVFDRLVWGWHLSLALLAGGMLISGQDGSTYLIIFISSIATGLAIPFLLLRSR